MAISDLRHPAIRESPMDHDLYEYLGREDFFVSVHYSLLSTCIKMMLFFHSVQIRDHYARQLSTTKTLRIFNVSIYIFLYNMDDIYYSNYGSVPPFQVVTY